MEPTLGIISSNMVGCFKQMLVYRKVTSSEGMLMIHIDVDIPPLTTRKTIRKAITTVTATRIIVIGDRIDYKEHY
jgi:hypothetical protein